MSHSVETVGRGNSMAMCTNLRIFQLNVRKRDVVQLSMMNDRDSQDFAVLAVAEPYALNIDGVVVTTPDSYRNWIKFFPIKRHAMQWLVRSMLWIRSDLEAEQVPIPSVDLTGAILGWPDREVLVISAYVEGKDEQALHRAMVQLHATIASFRNSTGKGTDVVLAGDFNRHDQLWEGDEVTSGRQGEAGPIIDLMDEHGLLSFLPRGRKTWEGPGCESMIDLMLASAELAEEVVHCGIHPTEHGSDHRAIQTEIDLTTTERTAGARLLFKNAPWNANQGENEGEVAMPNLTMEEVEEKVMEAKGWKAPGEDGLPAMVWKQQWPAVKERNRKSMEADLAVVDLGQDPRNRGGGQDLVCGRAVRTPTHQSLWGEKATILVNGYCSERQRLPQVGLPQGSPLSPMLFLFFNADLMQSKIDSKGGSIAFINNYSTWVTGTTERRSRATFEYDKTTVVHFTRATERTSHMPFIIKGEEVKPKQEAIDTKLRLKEHIASAASKGLSAAICLRRLKMLSPCTARQLLVATIALAMDYASVV
ncbi:hypothetical protein ACKAV7_000029 [Fusarium commune]